MSTELERRLAEFVDRDAEMRFFCEMLVTGEKPVMMVWGDSGLGKSSLLARMLHECALRKLRKTEVVWTETRNHDYLAIMRKIRDDVGVDHFKPFTDLVNYFTVPEYKLKIVVEGEVTVAERTQIIDARVGDIAGMVIKDSMFVVHGPDRNVAETERMTALTHRFITNLAAVATQELVVIFFDAVEKMNEDTQKWVWGELIEAIKEGRLPNIRLVLCGQKPPQLDRATRMFVVETELCTWDHAVVVEYLAKRGIAENSRVDIADTLLAATGGNPLQIAVVVDALLRRRQQKG